MVVLGGGAVSYERGTLYTGREEAGRTRAGGRRVAGHAPRLSLETRLGRQGPFPFHPASIVLSAQRLAISVKW